MNNVKWDDIKVNDIIVWHHNANKLILITEVYSLKKHLSSILSRNKKMDNKLAELKLSSLFCCDDEIDIFIKFLNSGSKEDFLSLERMNEDLYLKYDKLSRELLSNNTLNEFLKSDHHYRSHRGVQLIDSKSRVSSTMKDGQGWLIYEGDPLEKPNRYLYSLATDKDIIAELSSKVDTHSLKLTDHKVSIDEEGISLFSIGCGESFIYLDKNEAFMLKDFLNKMI